ncbi:hypothetical protein ACJZ2D_013749 [Fusarium nematophilum]
MTAEEVSTYTAPADNGDQKEDIVSMLSRFIYDTSSLQDRLVHRANTTTHDLHKGMNDSDWKEAGQIETRAAKF